MSQETKMTSLVLSQLFACFSTLGICNFSTWFLALSKSHESETSPPNGWESHSPHAGPSSWWPAVNQTVGKQVDGATNTHVSSQKGSTPSNNIRSSSSFRPLSPSLIHHEADYSISGCKTRVFQNRNWLNSPNPPGPHTCSHWSIVPRNPRRGEALGVPTLDHRDPYNPNIDLDTPSPGKALLTWPWKKHIFLQEQWFRVIRDLKRIWNFENWELRYLMRPKLFKNHEISGLA